MAIEYAKLWSLTARELISALIRDGFVLDRQKGSHQHFRHADRRRVTISFHSAGDPFKTKTPKAMVEIQAGWDESDLERLGLLR